MTNPIAVTTKESATITSAKSSDKQVTFFVEKVGPNFVMKASIAGVIYNLNAQVTDTQVTLTRE